VVILYEFNKKWRTIWTGGRQLPKDVNDVPEPWTALVLPLRLQSPKADIREMECSPSETALYNKLFANPAAGVEP
jgi:hypothetical protein